VDIELAVEDLAFRDEVREFLQANAQTEGENYFAWRLRWFKAAAAKGGWDVPKWPREFGGPGWTPSQHYVWERESAAFTLPIDSPFGVMMLAPILMTYGTKAQQAQHMPGIRSRKINWCQGYSEPGAGSDLANLKTRAVLSPDRTQYLVNGTKIWTSAAHLADWMFCLTRTSEKGKKQEGITFLLFPMKQPGVEVKPIITLGGRHLVNMVHLTDIKVPVENRVGEEGKGWTYAKGLLQHERTGLAGIARSVVAVAELKEKARSIQCADGTLMDDPAFSAKVAAVEIDIMAAEFTELRSVAAASAGGKLGPESSILKLKGTEIQQRIQKLLVEAGGVYAAAYQELPTGPKFARDAMSNYLSGRAATIYGGASEVQKDVIWKNVLKGRG
jgi:alkylation response protein AidB-like acyl-CoA dehydrogenase